MQAYMGLTKYPEGSIRELWTLSFPLMLSSFSILSMIFADRWLLAHYSTDAHNAAVTATTLGWAFIFGWVALANIAEVFVAQYNGAGLKSRLGEPIWQMLWLSLASWLFFYPLSNWGTELFFGSEALNALERDYFSQMLLFGPFYPACAALCGFFIGQGKTRLVTLVVIFANIANIIFDQILIFGIEGWVPSLGVKGAAIATSLSTILQVIILSFAFFSKTHRCLHGTLLWHPKLKIIWDCLRIGFPNAIFFVCEILAFAVYYAFMKKMGNQYITIVGICQTMIILCSFFSEGINKATAAIVGNFIGAGRSFLVPRVIMAGFKLNAFFFIAIFIGFYFSVPLIIQEFLPTAETSFIAEIQPTLQICLLWMAVYLFFDGLRFQFSGILTAAGDTVFLFFAGTLLVWSFMVAPVYLLVVEGKASVVTACLICVIYSILTSALYFWRIYQGKWSQIVISSELQRA